MQTRKQLSCKFCGLQILKIKELESHVLDIHPDSRNSDSKENSSELAYNGFFSKNGLEILFRVQKHVAAYNFFSHFFVNTFRADDAYMRHNPDFWTFRTF